MDSNLIKEGDELVVTYPAGYDQSVNWPYTSPRIIVDKSTVKACIYKPTASMFINHINGRGTAVFVTSAAYVDCFVNTDWCEPAHPNIVPASPATNSQPENVSASKACDCPMVKVLRYGCKEHA